MYFYTLHSVGGGKRCRERGSINCKQQLNYIYHPSIRAYCISNCANKDVILAYGGFWKSMYAQDGLLKKDWNNNKYQSYCLSGFLWGFYSIVSSKILCQSSFSSLVIVVLASRVATLPLCSLCIILFEHGAQKYLTEMIVRNAWPITEYFQ